MMCEKAIVRGLLLRTMRGLPASHAAAKSMLAFGRKHGNWLLGLPKSKANALKWTAFKQAVKKIEIADEPIPAVLAVGQELARLLEMDDSQAEIAQAMLAFSRLRRASELSDELAKLGFSLPTMIGESASVEGCDADRLVRQHPFVRLGLVSFKANWRGKVEMDLSWSFERLLDRQPGSVEEIIQLVVGPLQRASLPFEAFAHVHEADFLRRLLVGALASKAAGINILIYGPPGTGKTEFARSLAHEAGCRVHAVGEADEDGEEPSRFDRICSYQMGQRLLKQSRQDALLFDEMEDFIGDVEPRGNSLFRGREGSKVFVNRLLETNAVPTIWTTNTIGNVDPAILRRMSFVLKLGLPSRTTALSMLDRVAQEERIAPTAEWSELLERVPESASVIRVAARAARLAGEDDAGVGAAKAVTKALRGCGLPPERTAAIDLELYECDRSISALLDAVTQSGHRDVTFLLTGPPGTGKTALAHHFARSLDQDLLVKRTSDLLSKWVGQTEANIAAAFEEAREKDCMLLFDEVDSLLFNRSTARNTWEVSQVNELLTWLDHHPLPVMAATNFAERLDPATARRFDFKLGLKPLSLAKRAQAFERFFEQPAPAGLRGLDNLTPGDFAVVARQLRFETSVTAEQALVRLAAESRAKTGARSRIGF